MVMRQPASAARQVHNGGGYPHPVIRSVTAIGSRILHRSVSVRRLAWRLRGAARRRVDDHGRTAGKETLEC